SLYILCYIAIVKPESQTITKYNITRAVFNQLKRENSDTLSCSCSKVEVPFKAFVSNKTIFHPVCKSIFVDQRWIETLYLKDASTYGAGDFRTTAYSQFRILASLCSLSQDTVYQNQLDLDNYKLINSHLLSKIQIEQKVNATVEFFKNNASTRIISFLNYFRATIRANFMASALNTNFLIAVRNKTRGFNGVGYKLYSQQTRCLKKPINASLINEYEYCGYKNPKVEAGFLSISQNESFESHMEWKSPESNTTIVYGFFAGCTPLEALLDSTLDCLYNITCLQILTNQFPNMKQV
ncbi:unnamed protein product, partial [Adineta steineri]